MSMLPRIERILLIGAVLLGVIAVVAFVWPARVSDAAVTPGGINAGSYKAAVRTFEASAADAVIAGNIFSASRKAPARRFNPAAPEPVEPPPPVDNAEVVTSEEERVPQLFGIAIGPAGATALLRLEAGNPEAQIYREGERGGRYRVVKINERSVILEGPSGRIELRLRQPEGNN